MKLRHARLFVAVLAASTACKKSEQTHQAPPVVPVTPSGSDAATGSAAVATDDPWAKPEAKLDPLPRPLFWSIEKDGKVSYALGTMHMGVDPLTRLPPSVWKKFDEAQAFAMETDLSASGKLNIELAGDRTLRQELGDAHWKKLEDAIGKREAARLLRMKPMIPATMLSMRGLPQTAPMDGVLVGRAIRLNKKLVFLEDIEHEAALLEKWMTARALKDMLDDLAEGEKHSQEMFAAYVAGDDAKLVELADRERAEFKKHGRTDKEYDEQMEDLLYRRNAAWIAPIEKMHAEGGGFIAVGAMHLVGKRSVLELLQKRGYQITRVAP
jgi:uncharacterized protein YbaP (TraB family)